MTVRNVVITGGARGIGHRPGLPAVHQPRRRIHPSRTGPATAQGVSASAD